jgi:LPS sulfotransferase NodH
MQSISLYKATETEVFHTNIDHDEDSLKALKALTYDFNEIEKWRKHIVRQEQGWESYFYKNRIFPLNVFYEDIEHDVLQVMRRIATYIGVIPENVSMPKEESVFRKVRDQRNIEWAQRFAHDIADRSERLPRVFGINT